MTRLRSYQAELVDGIRSAWATLPPTGVALAVSPARSGKTVIFSSIISENQGGSVAIAHRARLVEQMSFALAKAGVRHRIIGPASLQRACSARHLAKLRRNFVDPSAWVAVASVNTLAKRKHEPWFDHVTLWVTDECFPAGTLVDGRPIETIRVGDYVTAFNEQTGALEQRRVVRLFKHTEPKHMMRIGTLHHVLECTQGHPFYTRRGWVDAGNLTLDDEVLVYDEVHELRGRCDRAEGTPSVRVSKNGTHLLQPGVREGVRRGQPETASQARTSGRSVPHVRGESGHVGSPAIPMEENRASVLQSGLLGCVSRAGVVGNGGTDEPGARFGQDESEKSDARFRDADKNARDDSTTRAPTEYSRRKRATTNESGNDTFGAAIGHRVCDAAVYTNVHETRFRLSGRIQAGHGASKSETGDRSGRGEPYGSSQGAGSEKGRSLTWTRLDRVEVFERSDTDRSDGRAGDGFVYNIEVEGLHTYVAGNIVVHNCHHLVKDSMWDKAIQLFKRARGLMVTATPVRADGKGLGRESDGVADAIVVGRSPRELITMGYLVDYRLVLAESDVDSNVIPIGASGEFVQKALADAVHQSKRFVGDVVKEYLRHGRGAPGITFAVDVESAKELVAEYRASGVPAELVTADTPDVLRLAIMGEFEAGRLKQLVNVDLFGEGVDLPDVHVVSMARHTNSYGLFIQQFWRGGTLLLTDEQHRTWSDRTDEQRRAEIAASAKPKFLVIDHVGNVMRHARARGLPCMPQKWSLESRERGGGSGGAADDVIPLRTCANPDPDVLMMLPGSPYTFRQFRGAGWSLDQVQAAGHAVRSGIPCGQPYERVEPCCPHCGYAPVPVRRDGPEYVDGNLLELDPAVLANMRGEVQVSDAAPSYNKFLGDIINRAHQNRHAEKMEAQAHLRAVLQLFCGYQMDHLGRSEGEMHQRFYFAFGVDTLTAQTLKASDAETLRARVVDWLDKHGVVAK